MAIGNVREDNFRKATEIIKKQAKDLEAIDKQARKNPKKGTERGKSLTVKQLKEAEKILRETPGKDGFSIYFITEDGLVLPPRKDGGKKLQGGKQNKKEGEE